MEHIKYSLYYLQVKSLQFQEVRLKTAAKFEKIGLFRETPYEDRHVNIESIKRAALKLYKKEKTCCTLVRTLQGPVISSTEGLPPLTTCTVLLVLFEEDKNMVFNQTVVIKIEDDDISSDSNTERAVNLIEEEQKVTRS